MQKPPLALNQCALYKVGSKNRLAMILGVRLDVLLKVAANPAYRIFPIPETTCEFTGKVTKARIVQEPVGILKGVHDRIRKLLSRVTTPAYAHGAIKGRSYRTNAEVHVSAVEIATFDISKFYPSTPQSVVFQFFKDELCCAPDVASLLTRLACIKLDSSGRLGLPTGSTLSPALSLFANRPMFEKLNRIALANQLTFTCYVDDLTFSGSNLPTGLGRMVESAVENSGHKLSVKKTRVFKAGQAKHVTGVVIKDNELAVPNARFLKARRISEVLNVESDLHAKLKLSQKLAGLLGEAAFLDRRYSGWARASYEELAAVQEEVDAETVGSLMHASI